MSKTLKWVIGIDVVIISIVLLFSMHMPAFGMRGPGYGMMGGFGLPFLGLGLFGMLLRPALFIGLSLLGVVWLAQTLAARSVTRPPAAESNCAHCGNPVQAGWKACPHCGEKI
jgi:hypothetical protein